MSVIIEPDIAVEHAGWIKALPDYEAIISRALTACTENQALGLPDRIFELSISLTDDANIQSLNHEYRGKDKPTNVLSFPQIADWSADSDDLDGPVLLMGDIVVALETIEREAREQDKSLENHFIHMLIHSFLHLLGYDHEEEEEAEAMEATEIHILAGIGIKNPYQTG